MTTRKTEEPKTITAQDILAVKKKLLVPSISSWKETVFSPLTYSDFKGISAESVESEPPAAVEPIQSLWGLPYEINLATVAADFYTLYGLFLDEQDDGRFQPFLDIWCHRFVTYTIMVIGGELRYYRGLMCPLAVPSALWDYIQLLSDEQYTIRDEAWREWKVYYDAHGIAALHEAREIYMARSNGPYGGPLWGNITDVLIRHLEGELSQVMFIDLVFGLEHNTGSYFNKLPKWRKTLELTEVLNRNKHGHSVLDKCSLEVREYAVSIQQTQD